MKFTASSTVANDIGCRGPIQIEGAARPGGQLLESYIANRKFLQNLFPPDA